jgi:beta-aspartyl-peptidase (threonine type)
MMWAIILHGGAKEIEPEEVEAHRKGCLQALAAGRSVLQAYGSAVDAVEAAIRELESNPTFNAGYGSALNADGEVEMCSALMDGTEFNVGGVAVIQGVRHPISVARAMLHEQEILLSGPGAHRFAAERGLELCDPDDLIAEDEQKANKTGSHDTVGCITLDMSGRLAVGTSTGGLDGSPAGRVGDSPQPGCGYYADNRVGAVAFSGDGEHIARKMLAGRVMHRLSMNDPESALETALAHVADIGGEAGGIILTPSGEFGWRHNSRDFAVAYQSSEMEGPEAFTRKEMPRD